MKRKENSFTQVSSECISRRAARGLQCPLQNRMGNMTISEWDAHFEKVRHSNILQHYPYAQTMRLAHNMGARHGLISFEGQPAGIVQIGEVGVLRNAIHALSLDRGPLWFGGFGNPLHVSLFFAEFNRQFPRRFGRRRRILPEVSFDDTTIELLTGAGLEVKREAPRYETIWVDISPSIKELRARLSGKWRNALSHAERQRFSTEIDWNARTSSDFIENYEQTKEEKQYTGATGDMLRTIIRFMAPRKEVLIMNALCDDKKIASVLVLLHGTCATYQASWSDVQGRKFNCHNRFSGKQFNS